MKLRLTTMCFFICVLAVTAISSAQDDSQNLPQSYEEVAEQYNTQVEQIIEFGETNLALFLDGNIETLYAQMSEEVKAQATEEQFQSLYQQIGENIGEQREFRALPLGNLFTYMTTYDSAFGPIMFSITGNEANEIMGFFITPISVLEEDPNAEFQSDNTYRLPFNGLWYTFWGGTTELYNYHVVAPPQRYAYDFVIWYDGSTYRNDGTVLEDYYCYGQPVLSPTDGEVVAVVDGLPESQPKIETDAENPVGNHVVIKVDENEYLYIAHMQPNSILVSLGDTVTVGQQIGLCGNSGNTSEPHIHIHLQTTLEIFTYDDHGNINGFAKDARGLPLRFHNYLANGELVEIGMPIGGQFIQNAP